MKTDFKNDKYCSGFKINNIKIVEREFGVDLLMDCQGKLKSVTITPYPALNNYEDLSLYNQLQEELIKKYGQPQISDPGDTITKKAWVFPSTEIFLVWIHASVPGILAVTYTQYEKQDLL